MKAIVYDQYGPLDALRLKDADKPVPKDNEVLVRVRAAGLHIGDCFGVRGAPFLMRVETGLLKPKHGVPGYDLAGVVEAVGGNVRGFHAGDEVFGATGGTCAEYVAIADERIAIKPSNLSYEEAAVLPTSGVAALRAIRDVAKVQAGQKVLINGASGGVGSFAVQIARSFDAEVTGVCSTGSVEMVGSLGADKVIDYTREDFTQGDERYDFIFDNVENHALSDVRRALTPNGTLVLNSGTGATGLSMLVRTIKPLILSPMSKQDLRRFISAPKRESLESLKELVDAGKLRPVIDRTYTLEQVPDALRYIESGHVHGKVVVKIE